VCVCNQYFDVNITQHTAIHHLSVIPVREVGTKVRRMSYAYVVCMCHEHHSITGMWEVSQVTSHTSPNLPSPISFEFPHTYTHTHIHTRSQSLSLSKLLSSVEGRIKKHKISSPSHKFSTMSIPSTSQSLKLEFDDTTEVSLYGCQCKGIRITLLCMLRFDGYPMMVLHEITYLLCSACKNNDESFS